jgi:hypothetical protein
VYSLADLNGMTRTDEAVALVSFKLEDEDVAYYEQLYIPEEV